MVVADRARARMVRALTRDGRVRTPAVAEAFQAVPRHVFLPGQGVARAYADEAVPVQHVDGTATSSASQPSMMAIMLEQLGPLPGHRVLEVGAGTGYNAALLAHLVGPSGSVVAIDIDPDLVAAARRHLRAAEVTGVEILRGDGALGHPAGAPYDRIVLTVGSAEIRPEWVEQLAPGGRLLLPLSVRGSQLSVALDLGPDGVLRSRSVRGCGFIRMRGVAARPSETEPVPGTPLGLQVWDGSSVDAGWVGAILAEPGAVRTSTVVLGSADVWDGFGLWLAVRRPGTARLVGEVGELLADWSGGPTAVVVAASGADGLAVVEPDPHGGPSRVREFGPRGGQAAVVMLEEAAAWRAAGGPVAADLRLTWGPDGLEPTYPG